MAVPKKRTGKSAQGHRRSNWKATVPETTICKNCGEIVLTHTVCSKCGSYKGKVVSIKAEGYVAEQETVKKTTKKASKTKIVEKAPQREDVKDTEVKSEETSEKVVEETKEEVEVKEEEKTEE